MVKTIKLSKQLETDGRVIKELKFDTAKSSQTMNNFCIREAARINMGAGGAIETDNAYHLVLGKSIAAASNDLVYEDLNDLSFTDALKLQVEGRGFLYQSLGYGVQTEDTEQETPSEEQPKSTKKSVAEN